MQARVRVLLVVGLVAGCAAEPDTDTGPGPGTGGAGPEDVLSLLLSIDGVVSAVEGEGEDGARFFELEFEQPEDHDAPAEQTFSQRLWIHHRGFDAPVVLASTGYALRSKKLREPALLVNGNQILVEHRFFPPSRPAPADFRHLRIRQAAADHHRIVQAFHNLYSARWLSAGVSKGGMASVYHRRFFPDDVQGTIAYVAPQSYGDADPRYVAFLEEVGDAACREALKAFQAEALSRRPAMTAAMTEQLGDSAYSRLGPDAALDVAVVELPFAFWQYQDPSLCAAIPGETATDEEVWAFLDKVAPPELWSDPWLDYYEPYYFQAAVELGYPKYEDSHLTGLLTVPPGFDVAASFVTPGPTKETSLDAAAMPDVAAWLAGEANRMLFVYGEYDPYSAAAFDPASAPESARFFAPGGDHGSLIADLAPADQEAALALVSAWAGVAPIAPPPPETAARAREGHSAERRFRPAPFPTNASVRPR